MCNEFIGLTPGLCCHTWHAYMVSKIFTGFTLLFPQVSHYIHYKCFIMFAVKWSTLKINRKANSVYLQLHSTVFIFGSSLFPLNPIAKCRT